MKMGVLGSGMVAQGLSARLEHKNYEISSIFTATGIDPEFAAKN